jgi:predicted Zn finger-like uncharacterized protein
VKFACDRCKTRYSIGDDRVRGKILKIRCKTCANVITVREGMPSPDGDEDPAEAGDPTDLGGGPGGAGDAAGGGGVPVAATSPRRTHKTPTAAPGIQAEASPPAPRGALGAAFASAMAQPPPALEDEWYVSLDGDQAGPFGLAEAQRWIAERPPEAELFCWREGFDEWLPVDKVSHFRGLRKPVPMPPPTPRPSASTADGPGAGAPRPLFAASMAQVEQGASPAELRARGAAGAQPHGLPAPRANGAAADAGGDMGDDLDIGEVSRVVKLADLARDASRRNPQVTPPPPVALARVRPPTGAVPRLELPRLGELAPGPLAGGAAAAPELVPAPEASPPDSHRRALMALIAGAVVLVGVAVAVVFFVLTGRGEQGGSHLGQVEEIDTTRPEELRPVGSGGGGSSVAITDPTAGSSAPKIPKRIVMQPTGPGSAATPEGPETGARLEAREIEEMASKNSSITQRCYMRAQRGADGILVGDVKKIVVTLTINAEGQVTDTQVSDNHAQDSLGKCLIGAMRGWRFRASPGGTFRFVLHFG